MIHIPINQLEPNMVLAAPVRHPVIDDHVLLQSGYSLEEKVIAQLGQLSVQGVWISHSGFDFLDAKLGAEIPRRRVKLYASVKRCFGGLADKTAGSFDPIEYRTVIGDMIMSLVANKNNAVWAERLMDGDGELFAHGSNVAYLSLIIGLQIKNYIFTERKFVNSSDGRDLTNLGIGAMLHDLGKLGLAPDWQSVHFLDPEAEESEYREHTERGYKAVQGRLEATATQILLHHHQRFDGLGFPHVKARDAANRMKGRAIHIFSRIVSVANAIDVVIADHKARQLPVVAALAFLKRLPRSGMFDPVVLDAALRVVPPFPLGAFVLLSDGRKAVVTDLNSQRPCRPKVTLFFDGSSCDPQASIEIDLTDDGAPAISRIGDMDVDPSDFYGERSFSLNCKSSNDKVAMLANE